MLAADHALGMPRANPGAYALGALASDTGRERFCEAVRRGVELIHAGDVFQVNLTHRLRGSFRGDARSLAADLFALAQPWYGGYLEIPAAEAGGVKRAIVSLSPELFFRFDPRSRRIVTRPMKGTRPGIADPRTLHDSAKDSAELDMIIDLMRNDFGRMCEFGSVRVEERRTIESHAQGGLWQAVGQIAGLVRPDLGLAEILRALFPAGSITGAPKVRAMQIIDELEMSPRGPYCGAFGVILPTGEAIFNVAIRTALITGIGPDDQPGVFDEAVLEYGVGAGIVAESDPEAEWRETLDKASMLRSITTLRDLP